MDEVIRTEKLTKKYGEFTAVSEMSLHVRKSEIYGFLGLNGAGKTTTIRMLLGMISPSSGSSYINGVKVRPGDIDLGREVGYLVEIPYSYSELTVRENLEIFRRYRLLPDKSVVDKIMEKLNLTQYANKKASKLSLGNSQRLGLAKALIHNPQILILDEPANGLDPAGIFEIRQLIKDLAANHGVTVFISSHILGEISRFATRIGIIHNGLLIQEINTPELEVLCQKRLIVNTENNSAAESILLSHKIDAIINRNNIIEISDNESILNPGTIATLLVNSNLPPSMLNVSEEDLESYFLRTIGINQ